MSVLRIAKVLSFMPRIWETPYRGLWTAYDKEADSLVFALPKDKLPREF